MQDEIDSSKLIPKDDDTKENLPAQKDEDIERVIQAHKVNDQRE